MTGYGDVPTAVSALKGGAVDFIQKPFGYREVLSVIAKAFARDSELRAQRTRATWALERYALLSERDVMKRVADGELNRVIAAELGISIKTVEFHRAHVMAKLCVASVAELVQRMVQLVETGLLPSPH